MFYSPLYTHIFLQEHEAHFFAQNLITNIRTMPAEAWEE